MTAAARTLCSAVLLLGAAGVASAAEEVTLRAGGESFAGRSEEATFPRELVARSGDESWRLVALGSGTRRQMLFRVYEIAAYAEAGAPLGDEPAKALVEGRFVRHLTMHFLRDVTGDKVRDAYSAAFRKTLPNPTKTLAAERDRLLGYVEAGVGAGETIEFTWIPDTGLFMRLDGAAKPVFAGDDLARALWMVYFGPDPLAADLKADMLRFVRE